jgi:hypothetical protein
MWSTVRAGMQPISATMLPTGATKSETSAT